MNICLLNKQVQIFTKHWTGVIFADGPLWKEHRKFMTKTLREMGVGKMSLDVQILQEIQCCLNHMEQLCQKVIISFLICKQCNERDFVLQDWETLQWILWIQIKVARWLNFESILTTFEANSIFKAAGTKA